MPSFEFVGQDFDPFAPRLARMPAGFDPFAQQGQDQALASSMTHYPEAPNPAAPYLQGTRDFLSGGILQTLRGQGVQLPDWLTKASDVAQSEPFNAALGVVTPGYNALESIGNTLSKTERFNWPVKLSYGKTIDMPVSVNPSRSMIQRELAQAPHGDVRALKAPNGDVYLWPANEAMHVDIADTFDLPFKTRQQLQAASYLFNKADVDKLGRFKNFDDLITQLNASADQPLQRDVLARGRTGRPIQTKPLPIGNEDAVLEAGARLNEPSPSITAYHGSPHDFEKFDLSKIGTGEGAQAYGHGLYFAENPEVAGTYKSTSNKSNVALTKDDIAWQPKSDAERFAGDLARHYAVTGADDPVARAVKELDRAIGSASATDPLRGYYQEGKDALSGVQAKAGRMYQVSIKADPEHFLDWDKPLSEQSEHVRKSLNDAWMAHPEAHANRTGAQIYHDNTVSLSKEGGVEHAAAQLRQAGIPGIKYFDQGSRAGGEGTRNYVVFDDKLIDILKKYGIAGIGMLPALGAYHFRTQQVDHDPFATQ